MPYAALDPLHFDLDAGRFPHEATCLCDLCLLWDECTECGAPTAERNSDAFTGFRVSLHDSCAQAQRDRLALLFKCTDCGTWWTIPSGTPNVCVQCEVRREQLS